VFECRRRPHSPRAPRSSTVARNFDSTCGSSTWPWNDATRDNPSRGEFPGNLRVFEESTSFARLTTTIESSQNVRESWIGSDAIKIWIDMTQQPKLCVAFVDGLMAEGDGGFVITYA
jgi:hypothetical protein